LKYLRMTEYGNLIVMGALYYLRPHEIPEMRWKMELSTAKSHLGNFDILANPGRFAATA
jgi:hypothetical protein